MALAEALASDQQFRLDTLNFNSAESQIGRRLARRHRRISIRRVRRRPSHGSDASAERCSWSCKQGVSSSGTAGDTSFARENAICRSLVCPDHACMSPTQEDRHGRCRHKRSIPDQSLVKCRLRCEHGQGRYLTTIRNRLQDTPYEHI